MRQKRLRQGVLGLMLAASAIFLLFPQHVPISTQSPDVGAEPSTSNQGVVVADDEPTGGRPKQVSVERDTPSDVPVKLARATPSAEERYITINNKVYPLRTYQALSMPNDPSANQWWVNSTKLSDTWDLPLGPLQTTLAIIDTGVALAHEEFEGRWHENSQEVGATVSEGLSKKNCSDRGIARNQSCNLVDDNADGIVDNESGAASSENPSLLNCTDQGRALDKRCNRIDDDSNGLIDDVTGWDFVDQHRWVQAGKLNMSGDGTTHGTMVAGVAAATGNNNKGIAGADWHTKILPIQAMDDDGYGDTRTVGDAISYAIEQGADVINLSLGTSAPDSYVREAIELATASGIVVVAASGNDGCNCILYPAGDSEVIAVGALDTNAARASFSSWGNELDIMAPGVGMTLPSWSAAKPSNAYASGAAGTSFASPLVAGVISMMRSHSAELQPLHIIAALTEHSTRATTTSFDVQYGFGRLDALAATNRILTPQQAQLGYQFGPVSTGGYLSPSAPYEQNAPYLTQECVTGTASTSIYELKKAGQHFFSISKVEVRHALASGYTSSLFTYACQQLPHDAPVNTRTINLFGEFRNIYRTP